MDHIVISGMPPYDGRYEWDGFDTGFTTREWGWIKRHCDYLPDRLVDGWVGGDQELVLMFAVIAMRRAGKIDTSDVPDVFDRLSDAPPRSTLRYEHGAEVEDDAGPPAQPSPASSNGSDSSSGSGSPTSSEMSDSVQNATGTPASVTSVSAPARSVS